MRLQNYMKSATSLSGIYTDLFEDIMKQCKPFMKEWLPIYKKQNEFLYRGMKAKDFGIKKVRTDRRPQATSEYAHKLLDDAFNKKFGWKARSNAIFCTGDYYFAEGYSDSVYAIFPIGKYKYIWSLEIDDLTLNIHSFGDIVSIDKNYTDNFKKTLEKDNKNTVDKIIKTYTDKDLGKALSSDNEIMVNCKEYYYIKVMSIAYDEFNIFLKQNT